MNQNSRLTALWIVVGIMGIALVALAVYSGQARPAAIAEAEVDYLPIVFGDVEGPPPIEPTIAVTVIVTSEQTRVVTATPEQR